MKFQRLIIILEHKNNNEVKLFQVLLKILKRLKLWMLKIKCLEMYIVAIMVKEEFQLICKT